MNTYEQKDKGTNIRLHHFQLHFYVNVLMRFVITILFTVNVSNANICVNTCFIKPKNESVK